MAQFFIDRPIFAWVIALFILVLGGVAITQLPVAQYPPVAPPSIVVTAAYPGASAQTLEDSVHQRHRARDERLARPDLHGVGGQANGTGQITLSFEPGTNPDLAQVDVQNRLSRATPRLPAAVTQQGVRVDKARTQLPAVHHPVVRQPGVRPDRAGRLRRRATCCPRSSACPASARRSCSAPSARCASGSTRPSWSGFKLSAADVERGDPGAERAGVVGHDRRPAQRRRARASAATVVVQRPAQPRSSSSATSCCAPTPTAPRVRLRDVARIELGAQSYATSARLNGKPSTGIGVQLVAHRQRAGHGRGGPRRAWTSCRGYFPPGVKCDIPYDSSRFVKISISAGGR